MRCQKCGEDVELNYYKDLDEYACPKCDYSIYIPKKQKKVKGGKKKKMGKRTEWNKRVMKIYNEKKTKNPNYKLGDAMKEAKKGWK